MEEQQKIEEAVDHLREHINTRYELVVLKASEQVSGAAAAVLTGFLVVFIAVFSFVLLSFAGAFYINYLLGDQYTGFMLVGGIYLLIGVCMAVFRKKMLILPLRNRIIREFYKEG